jgi:hypothetical protein
LSILRPIFITTSASVCVMRSASTVSGRVPTNTVNTSSPQVIGSPVAVQAPDIPVMAGTISTGASSRKRL